MSNLPKGWQRRTLAETCHILAGFGFPERLQGKSSGDFPFYKVGDISETWKRGDTYLTTANHYLGHSEAAEIRARPLPRNTTVFAKIGAAIALNRRAILSVPALVDNNVMGLHPATEDLDPKFLFHFVCTLKLDELSRATTVPSVRKSDIEQIQIPVPPLPDQREIVAEIEKQFTRLDAGIAALSRTQANLKRYRAAVLKAACKGFLVPTKTKWEKTTLGEVSAVLSGYGFPEHLQGRATGDIGFFKVGDISAAWKRNEKSLRRANHYISKKDLAELRAKLLPTGTVVFAKIGAAIALNRRAIVGEPSLVDNNVMGLFAGDRIHPRYLFHFLCTQKLDELARATTVPSIRKGDVESIELELPSLAEQTRIVEEVERRLSVVEDLETVMNANLQRATRLRQSILQQAFQGDLVASSG